MKKFILFILVIAFSGTIFLNAQNTDRRQWFNEMREIKHDYLAQQLKLSKDQKEKFFEVYDKMDDEITNLNSETRALERKIYDAPEGKVSDLEYEVATNAMLDLKSKESEIEKQYYEQLDKILTKKQLFELKRAERSFSMKMMKQHHKIKTKAK